MQQGQALWRPKQGYPEIAGDLVMATDDTGRCLILFDKTPMSMVSVQTTSTNWLVRFPQADMMFTGHGQKPARLAWTCPPRRRWPGNRCPSRCSLSVRPAAAGGSRTPARANPWTAFFHREFIPETLVVGAARGGRVPGPDPAAF